MSDLTRINVLGISGSLRKDSFNTATLRAAQELTPDGINIRIKTLEDIPVYNEDLSAQGYPAPVGGEFLVGHDNQKVASLAG